MLLVGSPQAIIHSELASLANASSTAAQYFLRSPLLGSC